MTNPASALPWVRDFTFVGGVTGFLAPFMVIRDRECCAATGSLQTPAAAHGTREASTR